MKRILFFVVAALALSARPAYGGIDLTWNACNVDGGATSLTLDCSNPGTTHRLLGCFRSPQDLDMVYLDCVLDIQFETLSDPPQFWDFEAGGCNGSGFTVVAVDPITSCPSVPNPWGTTNVEVFVHPMSAGSTPGRTRLGIAVYRNDGSHFPVVAGQNTFAFELAVSMANGSTCAGCDARGVIAWNWALGFGTGGAQSDVTAGGTSAPCVTFNGGGESTCDVVPARRNTWGAIKSLYR